MKRALLLMGLVFAVTLAVVFGFRASADALAVVLGVLLGVVASVPSTALLMYVLMRSRSNTSPPASHQGPAHPPVVVINAPDKPNISGPPSVSSSFNTAPPSRKWTVIGDMETDE